MEPVSITDPALLEVFVKDSKKALAIMEATLQNINDATEEDLRLFTVHVHATKSNLANIGEKTASELALSLEKAGKERDRSTIRAKTQILINTLKKIVKRIEDKKESPETAESDEDTDYLDEQLKIICDACETYDARSANAALSELNKKSWSPETKALIDKIAEDILFSEFEKAAAHINERAGSSKT
jgi:HPt (histidine-containing phosphotransfer) domain-containing protein